MKKLILKHAKISGIAVFMLIFTSILLYASPGGFTGRTKKTSNNGCGGCHGPNANTEVIVSINGPDTVNTGQTAQFTLTVSKNSKSGAGLNLAVRSGTLAPVSSNIHLSNGELTHNANLPLVSGSVTVQFNYTAGNSALIDTIWATGLATNSDNSTSGDDWNWANSKRVIVRSTIGIKNISNELPENFSLSQNYPNPFNPATKIRFNLPKNSEVKLSVFDMSGKEVSVIINGSLNAGEYEADWNPADLASGIYFYTLKTADFSETKKMIFLK
jgi:hypothetical protein